MNKEQKKLVKDLATNLILKHRDGESFYALELPNEELQDAIRTIHGTDILPDDFRFKVIKEVSDTLYMDYQNTELDEIDEKLFEIADPIIDVYTAKLTAWLASHLSRVEYVDQALEELEVHTNTVGLLQYAQACEINDIISRYIDVLRELE